MPWLGLLTHIFSCINVHHAQCFKSAGFLLTKMEYSISPLFARGYVHSPPTNLEILRNIYTALKRLCMICALKYASKAHSKDSLAHYYSNCVVICSNDRRKTVIV